MNSRVERSLAAARPVTSLQNERVKAIRALDMRKVRRETGLFIAEGASLLITAREHGFRPEILVYQAGTAAQGMARGLVDWALAEKADVLEASEAVLGKLAAKDNPQTMLAVFRQRWSETPVPARAPKEGVWAALEEVRDPGNLGTIIRTVDAVGGQGVLLIGDCCDPYSRECVRASMGSIFAVSIARLTRADFARLASQWTGDVVGLHLRGTVDFRQVDYKSPVLLVMGSEGPGLSDELSSVCGRLVKIPMAGRLDSLNLAVAAALALYQVRGPFLTV